MNSIAISHGIIALVIMGLSSPPVRRKIRRNQLYGIRIPEAFKSEERWLEINEYGGRLLLRWGIALAVTAGIGLALPRMDWIIYAFISLAVILGGLGIVTALIFRYAAKTKNK
jgi:uncharacterized membrane protein